MATLVHINQPRGHHIGQVRLLGHQRWQTVTGRCKSAEGALSLAIRRMGHNHHRARALFIDDSGWYEPHLSMDACR